MKSKELKEVGYLYLIQIVNFVLPIFLMTYLVKILGLDGYGKLSFYQISSLLMIFIVDFGFNQSSAQKFAVSDARDRVKIFNNTQSIKFFISIFIIIFTVFFLSFDFFSFSDIDKNILLISSLTTFGTVLSSAWLYQAIGKNSALALITIFFRLISFFLIIFTVKVKDDLMYCIWVQFFSSILIGLFSLCYLIRRKITAIDYKLFDLSYSFHLVRDSYHIFLASSITLGFTYLNPLFVKYFFGDAFLGLYSIADKVSSTLKMVFSPFIQAFYSKFCTLANQHKYWESIKLSSKIIAFFLIVSFIGFLLNIWIGNYIYNLFFSHVEELIKLLNIMILSQAIVGVAMVLVNLNIIPLGRAFVLKRFYLIGLFFHFTYLYFLISNYGVYGIALSVFLTELILVFLFALYLFFYFKKNKCL